MDDLCHLHRLQSRRDVAEHRHVTDPVVSAPLCIAVPRRRHLPVDVHAHGGRLGTGAGSRGREEVAGWLEAPRQAFDWTAASGQPMVWGEGMVEPLTPRKWD